MRDANNVHLLLFDVRSARTLCGLRVHAFYPNTEGATCTVGCNVMMIDCTTSPAHMTCQRCAAVSKRRADIKVTSSVK